MSNYQEIKRIISSIEEDATKSFNGNEAAGTRYRNSLQKIIKLSKEERQSVISLRKPKS